METGRGATAVRSFRGDESWRRATRIHKIDRRAPQFVLRYGYDERYCYIKGERCQRTGVLAFWDWNRTKFEHDPNITATINREDVPNLHDVGENYVVLRNSAAKYELGANDTVVGASKLMIQYRVGVRLHDKTREDPHAQNIEWSFTKAMKGFQSPYFDVWPDNRALRQRNSRLAIAGDRFWINLCLFIVLTYTMLTMASCRDHRDSHAFLGSMAGRSGREPHVAVPSRCIARSSGRIAATPRGATWIFRGRPNTRGVDEESGQGRSSGRVPHRPC